MQKQKMILLFFKHLKEHENILTFYRNISLIPKISIKKTTYLKTYLNSVFYLKI